MDVIADLHIHSRYSRATSSRLTPPHLDRWARIKGLCLVGAGDCTHPRWLEELREHLQEAEEGFYVLKDEFRRDFDRGAALVEGLPNPQVSSWGFPRFVLTGEISAIYSREGRTRKVHHVALLPDFQAAASFQARLEKIGNIRSDGRPILGLDSRDLLEILLESDPRSVLIPAHIWTPWFSVLGARSGFDSIEECYRDLAPFIHAIETGLSSNPPMNWAVSALDRFAVISNSDAHSPDKLGREATIFDMEPSFAGLREALAGTAGKGGVRGTVEFFPQEGKYHYDGHRNCGVCLDPDASAAAGGLCPVCGKPLTPGVLRRVREVADRRVDEGEPCPAEYEGTNRRPYRQLVPLRELLAELLGVAGAQSKKAGLSYNWLVEKGGSEFAILMDRSLDELAALDCPGIPGPLLAAAISRMRSGDLDISPGYDGKYGIIRACPQGAAAGILSPEKELFEPPPAAARRAAGEKRKPPPLAGESRREAPAGRKQGEAPTRVAPEIRPLILDRAQEEAISHPGGPALVIAGPGTGKTAVLALRIARLVERGVDPRRILALSFTVKAALELRDRIAETAGRENAALITAGTFHSLGHSILKARAAEAGLSGDFSVLDEEARTGILEELVRGPGGRKQAAARGKGRVSAAGLGRYIEGRKRFLLLPGDEAPRLGREAEGLLERAIRETKIPPPDSSLEPLYGEYRDTLKTIQALDFDDLPAGTVRLLAAKPGALLKCRETFSHIFADEYQDINFANYALLRLLAPGAAEICVIGDPNQAIYGFRGADKGFIDHFLADYPGAAAYRLAKSFRCAAPIIQAASRLAGTELVGTELRGEDAGVSLYRSAYPSDKAEAEGIARRISALIGGTGFFALDSGVADPAGGGLISLGQCAVLIRAGALAPPIEKALQDHGLPYRLVGEIPWWETEPARSALRILRDARRNPAGGTPPALSPGDAVEWAAGLLPKTGPADGESLSRLRSLAANYQDLPALLDVLAMGSPGDGMERAAEEVSVMTIHASKGLEFDQVFVAGLEEGLLPFTLFDRDEDIEEERRLLYVAMTRARRGLHLSWASARTFRGRKLSLGPSRFLADLEDLVPAAKVEYRREADPQRYLF